MIDRIMHVIDLSPEEAGEGTAVETRVRQRGGAPPLYEGGQCIFASTDDNLNLKTLTQ